MSARIDEHIQYVDSNGDPIVNGFIYIGLAGSDPKVSPITIYSDRDLTITLANPQRTDADGRAINKIWIPGRFSVKIEDVNNVQKYQELDNGEDVGTKTVALSNVLGSNAITADGSPTVAVLVDKAQFILQIVSENTTDAVTLKIDGTAIKSIKRNFDQDIGEGKFKVGQTVKVIYNLSQDIYEWTNHNQVGPATFSKSALYTVAITERNQLHILSGTDFTVTLPLAATAGPGFPISFKFDGTEGTDVYTIDGDGTETIDSELTRLLISSDEVVGLVGDGSNWHIASETKTSRSLLVGWHRDNVDISLVDSVVVLFALATSDNQIIMTRSGSITGIAVHLNAARTAGTATFQVTKNGTGVGLTAVLDGTNTNNKATVQAKGLDTYVAGDRIGVTITTDGSWAPTTTDADVSVEIEQ